jgi:hypothetical protein
MDYLSLNAMPEERGAIETGAGVPRATAHEGATLIVSLATCPIAPPDPATCLTWPKVNG